ncbi:CBS domain-containing protein [Pseudidiomarina andamanensis]|uniref:CBS domain-containing protein n=1 Tax=Pseudidiomarina andamanensis TaxID=1940690 RepID=A0AA92ILE6_9GAMM|nr:CBS domain-containing protein [Pseudidiomarina andamanensis]MDS0218427.1 CBS domain-containing protein [Pseudidiomarina andamanensis]QGT95308.1 CBS domain-containing protein [Pseudidiomarina andamanensis]
MHSLKVVDYMNRHPVSFSPEMSIEAAVSVLLQSNQRGGPVVDAQHKLVGFLSEQDCLATMLRDTYHNEQSATVGDCMYRGDVVTIDADSSVTDLAQQMTANKPKMYPVVDAERQLIGVITRTDVLRAIDLHLRDGYSRR